MKEVLISHIPEMCNTTVRKKRYMTYKYHLKQPFHMCEKYLIMMNEENPHIINALDRSNISFNSTNVQKKFFESSFYLRKFSFHIHHNTQEA